MSTPHGDTVPQDQAQSEPMLSSSEYSGTPARAVLTNTDVDTTTIHYHGTVNNIRRAHNANFGENHGVYLI